MLWALHVKMNGNGQHCSGFGRGRGRGALAVILREPSLSFCAERSVIAESRSMGSSAGPCDCAQGDERALQLPSLCAKPSRCHSVHRMTNVWVERRGVVFADPE